MDIMMMIENGRVTILLLCRKCIVYYSISTITIIIIVNIIHPIYISLPFLWTGGPTGQKKVWTLTTGMVAIIIFFQLHYPVLYVSFKAIVFPTKSYFAK